LPCAFFFDRLELSEDLPWEETEVRSPCQFNVPETSLIEFDNKRWCPFHLPMENTKGESSPKATWAEKEADKFNDKIFVFIKNGGTKNIEIDLTGVVFPKKIIFGSYSQEKTTIPDIRLSGAEFWGHTVFNNINFNGEVDFEKIHFRKMASFRRIEFREHSSFNDCYFYERATFFDSHFKSGASFDNSSFKEYANFSQMQFLESSYGNETSFEGAMFYDDADFVKTFFQGNSSFSEARFCKNARFIDAIFSSGFSLSKTIFFGQADFSCHGASSSIHASSGSDSLIHSDFHELDCQNAAFHGEVKFINRQFLHSSNFQNTQFLKAPKFHNCTLHQDTDFSGTKFTDFSGKASRAYRTLKLEMEKVRDRKQEARFYALEQKSLRHHPDTPLAVKLFSKAYEAASDYGQSFLKPLLWLCWFTMVFFFIYANILIPEGFIHPGESFAFAMEQIVRPFIVWTSQYAEKINGFALEGHEFHPVALKVTATFQSLISLGLVTLFILSLRRRFKMG